MFDLLRHGQTRGGARFLGSTDEPLAEEGWAQMWHAVRRDQCRWQRIIASPLRRCAAFAQTLGHRAGIAVTLDSRFQEMHFGRWEGLTAAQIMAAEAEALSNFWHDPQRHTPPDAEPLNVFASRVLAAWHDVATDYRGEEILLVTHGGVIRVILCAILQYPPQRLLELDVPHAGRWRVRVELGENHIRAAALETA